MPLLDQFEAENPGIKIINEPVSGNQVYPKFIAAVQGQQMPDIAEAYSYHPLQFAALDQMEIMDDIIADWETSGRLTDIVNDFAYKKFFWNDHYWGVPYNLDPRAIYYRKDLLEAKGIAPPTNWDELIAAAHRQPRSGQRRRRHRLPGGRLPHRPALLHGLHVPGRRLDPERERRTWCSAPRRAMPTSRR